MSKNKKPETKEADLRAQEVPLDNEPLQQNLGQVYSGTVHALVHKPHEGFANYAIATLEIKNGIVTNMTLGQPYNAFEAKLRMELLNDKRLEELRRTYPAEYRHG